MSPILTEEAGPLHTYNPREAFANQHRQRRLSLVSYARSSDKGAEIPTPTGFIDNFQSSLASCKTKCSFAFSMLDFFGRSFFGIGTILPIAFFSSLTAIILYVDWIETSRLVGMFEQSKTTVSIHISCCFLRIVDLSGILIL